MILAALDVGVRELTLFAAIGFLVGGVDDLLVDLAWLGHRLVRGTTRRPIASLPHPPAPSRIAIFVPTWEEAGVIGAMLSTALARLDHPRYRLYVGCYPNDRATIDAVANVAERDPRIRLVIGTTPGPTTKADNLNTLWRALRRDDAAVRETTRMVVLHDAEDVVHPAELTVYDALIAAHPLVQIPVVPLIDPAARLVSGHYADEFAESHGRQMVLRAAIGAGLPLSGVGCAMAVDVLAALEAAHGSPFDDTSLTEDYELGLRAAALGHGACFARVSDRNGRLVAVRAFFPATIATAVTQKSRWMTGIALAGWDRIGWSHWSQIADHWMRMRDRRAPIAVIVLAAAYLALIGWGLSASVHLIAGTAPPVLGAAMTLVLVVNAALLAWRLAWRVVSTTRAHGWREGLWSLPRAVVGNLIGLLAARHAAVRYARILAGGAPRWEKTVHVFPTAPDELAPL
ncbi:glycosyl transferase family protein [Sphingomonas radiodurans]|uniref:glycosyl transferase family protein n=1 Tax=Sphingomonas radiodurans TaxID=2890321 RepID=UPI001E3BC2A4|nr:glycosyl transferase family protein [Sphingomonas radiodurans]WBH18295.1 glycosyl transferase family protein [Sphingomonas radiodurans]